MLPSAFTRTPVPSELAPGPDRKLEMVVAAKGVQIYRCDPKQDQPGRYEWTFQAPEAVLRDVGGKYLGKHYAGPTWEAEDGSKVVGTVEARRDAPVRNAIPWLRLSARSTGGQGLFAGVTTVLRIGTAGGVPTNACTELQQGTIVRVPYSADYNFYVTR
jgi:hypothetical protein